MPRSTMASESQFAEDFLAAVRATASESELCALMVAATRELGFRHYALIHHSVPSDDSFGRIDMKDYPQAVEKRLFQEGHFRRDPILRACLFADSAFLWSDLDRYIELDRRDKASLAFGLALGLNQGITVPCVLLGDCIGSCTFAGTGHPDLAERQLGVVQVAGIFAFQAARRLSGAAHRRSPSPKLHPRPRDCVVLAGRGLSNKEIARALALSPRTVDGYLTEAREMFGAHDRTELVVSAVLAGEVGLHELRRQPE